MRRVACVLGCVAAVGCSGGGDDGGAGNHPPLANDDAATTSEDSPIEIDMLSNDEDADGDPVFVFGFTDPMDGTAYIAANGRFVYTPDPGFSGSDSLSYTLSDGSPETSSASVTITINPVGDAPFAVTDGYTTSEDAPLVVTALGGVLGNDEDSDSATLTASVVAQPEHGTVSLAPDGGFTYTPDADYTGADAFTYAASDGALSSDETTVALTVLGVNDAPVAAAEAFMADEDTPLSVAAASGVLDNDSDVEQQPLFALIASVPTNGTLSLAADGSFLYTPSANYAGTDSFAYLVTDGLAQSSAATVSLTVNAVNDAPVTAAESYDAFADQVLVTTAPGVLANDSDVDSTLLAVLLTHPANGTVVMSTNGDFSYTPAGGFTGTDSFTYAAFDGALMSAVTTVSLTVANDPNLQIATIRSTPDGSGLALPIEGALVTYVKPAVGAEPAGFFLQASQLGPAIFVAVPLAVSVGDELDLLVSEVTTVLGMKHVSAVSWFSTQSSNNPLAPLVQNVTNAADLVSNIASYESELVTIDTHTTSYFSTVDAFSIATVSSLESGVRLRVPGNADSLGLFDSCEVTVTAPLWRTNASSDLTAWLPVDATNVSCATQFFQLVTNNDDPSLAGPDIPSVWSFAGFLGQQAGRAMCEFIGAARVCDYHDLRRADLLGELTGIAEGQTIWLNRFTPVTIGDTTYAPGAGGRCNDWTYPGHHLADGETATLSSSGSLTFTLDPDACYTGEYDAPHCSAGANTPITCYQTVRAIACCLPALE